MKSHSAVSFENLIPLPRRIQQHAGFFTSPRKWRISGESHDPRLRRLLNRRLPKGWSELESSNDATLVLQIVKSLRLPKEVTSVLRKQAYRLEIVRQQISIQAETVTGLFYALQTLGQLLVQSNRLPCGVLLDWPELEMRGVHLTLGSGHMPPYEKLKEILEKLASFKFNYFLIEYDGSFSWEKYPFIAIPSALSKDQCRGLIATAGENFIELVPTIDSLGHQEHYLSHPSLKHLREVPTSSMELCASNPKSKAFIKDLWSEVLEVHADASYVNITGDEVFRFNKLCPRCQKFSDRGQLADLFFNYYNELALWMLKQGRRPMMWHDMLASHPERLADYPREILIMYWNYWGTEAKKWEIGHGLPTELLREDLPSVPRHLRKLYQSYWFQRSTKPDFTPWPYLRFFQDQGFDTLGASAGSPVVEEFPFAGFHSRIRNAKSMAQGVKSAGGRGLIHTYWSTFASLLTAWADLAAAGDYSWHPRDESIESYLKRFDALYLSSGGYFPKAVDLYDAQNYPERAPEFRIADTLPTPSLEKSLRTFWKTTKQHCQRHRELLDVIEPSLDMAALRSAARRQATARLLPQLGQGKDFPIDLSRICNGRTQRVIPALTGSNLALKPGRHRTHGVAVQIGELTPGQRNAILLQGEYNPDGADVVAIPLKGKKFGRLFFFHTAAYAVPGTEIARYEIHYNDGSQNVMPVVADTHVGDWNMGKEAPAGALVAWQGFSNAYDLGRRMLYLAPWLNPHPERPIDHIVLHSTRTAGYIILVAITGRRDTRAVKKVAPLRGPSLETLLDQFEANYRKIYTGRCVPEHIDRALNRLNPARYLRCDRKV
ncbi:MAG: hypothetical protein B9S32_03535 [Verrucomicrobia bacterium Tous-C9LFEB]|nr:MAG: hypothetical protein B9S32_03535 [Verrucomicrobia bacterium Tous-C9LFEB]